MAGVTFFNMEQEVDKAVETIMAVNERRPDLFPRIVQITDGTRFTVTIKEVV